MFVGFLSALQENLDDQHVLGRQYVDRLATELRQGPLLLVAPVAAEVEAAAAAEQPGNAGLVQPGYCIEKLRKAAEDVGHAAWEYWGGFVAHASRIAERGVSRPLICYPGGMQILAFGDSITFGSHVTLGWCDQLRALLYERFHGADPDGYPRMYNLGIPGETTEGLAARFDAETAARVRAKYGDTVFLFSFGTNDVARVGNLAERVVSIDRYEANLREVLEKAGSQTGRLALLASPPVIEGQPNPNGKNRLNADIREYNAVLARLASECGAHLLDLYAAFEGRDLVPLFSGDGLHPNAEGHAVIFGVVSDYLLSILSEV